MNRGPVFSNTIADNIIGSRRVGATLRQSCKVNGVCWDTFITWLRLGRQYNEATESKKNPANQKYGLFAAEIDKAGEQLDQLLRARVLAGTKKDPRLALDLLKYREGQCERNLRMSNLKLQQSIAKKRLQDENEVEQDFEDPGFSVPAYLKTPREEK